MENCIFCKIIKGEIPSYKVYEDEHFFAFLDIHPVNKGHVLVIPKKHYRWMWQCQEEYGQVVNTVAQALQKAFAVELVVSFVQGEEVHHAHQHLVPRFTDDNHGSLINLALRKEISSEEMKEIQQKIINAI